MLTARAAVAEIYIAPMPERIALAGAVVIGKVVEIEKKPVVTTPYEGAKDKQEHLVAVIKIDETLIGDKGLTHLRLGVHVPPDQEKRRRTLLPVNFAVGFEGCFVLKPHHEENFLVPDGYYAVIQKLDASNFEKLVQPVRRSVKLLADPQAGLQAKNADDRFLTAAMLMVRYRQGGGRTEPIAAEESKLILKALRDADWTRPTHEVYARGMFARLGLQPADGWTPPKEIKQYDAAAKAWLDKNADTYRIQRYVADKK
ncbi:MAG: hypothetical protein AB7K24_03565 [Gemmataceae bacterium]